VDPTAVTSFLWDKGPASILAFTVVLVLTGRLEWRKNLNDQIALLSRSWEDRLKAGTAETERVVLAFEKINKANEHLIETLKDDKGILLLTLAASVDNAKNLTSQVDELLELSRITPPILNALQKAREESNDRKRQG
jgi:hypothetical protein